MERNIANEPWKKRKTLRTSAFLFFTLLSLQTSFAQIKETLIDQTAATVGKRVIALREIQLDWAINQTLDKKRPYEELVSPTSETFELARKEVIRRALIRNYLTSTGLMPTHPDRSIERYKEELKSILPGKYSEYLLKLKTDETELESIFLDRFTFKTFLSEQLPLRTAVTESQMRDYYDREKEVRFLGQPYEKVKEIIREQLKREKMEKDLNGWFQTEMKRTEVVVLPVSL